MLTPPIAQRIEYWPVGHKRLLRFALFAILFGWFSRNGNAQSPPANATQLQGRPISNTAPASNQVLQWNGKAWVPATSSGSSCAGDINSGCNTVLGINGGSVPASAKVLGTNGNAQPISATQANVNALGYASGGGSANAQTVTLAPAITSLVKGLTVCWLPAAANTTTTPTLAVNGLTAATLVKAGGVALAASDLTTMAIACAIYDGTYFELQNPQATSGGGPSITSGTYANLPGSCTHTSAQSDLYFNSNSPISQAVCTATNTWTEYLPGLGAVTPPVLANFTAVNQASATTDTTRGGVIVANPTSEANFNIHAWMIAAPLTPYHVIVCWEGVEAVETSALVGAAFSNGTSASTSKFMIFGTFQATFNQIVQFYASNATTYGGSTPINSTSYSMRTGIPCVRIGDNAANRTYDISGDGGYTWQNIGSESSTSQFTAAYVGFYVNDGPANVHFVQFETTN